MKPWPLDKELPRWVVRTAHLVDGLWLHFFATRAKQRAFAQKHHGVRYDLTRSKHG
ncbi:hypothetical protein [Dyella lutea]|uniref:Uncharacterized protein n=1 Tax=Dyella lutea TaxID=2950441 RepID=A0ABT1FF42_9GAMM|nr:hypothetical protein [Dyella lutea]MCP1376012.1 hypothetical protein [Dyella lutea]